MVIELIIHPVAQRTENLWIPKLCVLNFSPMQENRPAEADPETFEFSRSTKLMNLPRSASLDAAPAGIFLRVDFEVNEKWFRGIEFRDDMLARVHTRNPSPTSFQKKKRL